MESVLLRDQIRSVAELESKDEDLMGMSHGTRSNGGSVCTRGSGDGSGGFRCSFGSGGNRSTKGGSIKKHKLTMWERLERLVDNWESYLVVLGRRGSFGAGPSSTTATLTV